MTQPAKPSLSRVVCAGGQHCRTCCDPVVGVTIRRQWIARYDCEGMAGADGETIQCRFGGRPGAPPDRSKLPKRACRAGRGIPVELMPRDGPGGVLHEILRRMGYEAKCDCGCAAFAMQMNRWGWTACLTWRQPQIVAWLADKAQEQRIELTAGLIAAFVHAAWQEKLSRVRERRKAGTKRSRR